jgi:hypothetical protein
MHYTLSKHFARLSTMLLFAAVLMTGCKKDDDDDTPAPGKYPKEVTIEYRITSTTGVNKADVTYTNETGGMSNIDNAAIAFSKKFKRTVKQYDVLGLSFSVSANGNLKGEILVDDKVVATQTFTGTSVIVGIMQHAFY